MTVLLLNCAKKKKKKRERKRHWWTWLQDTALFKFTSNLQGHVICTVSYNVVDVSPSGAARMVTLASWSRLPWLQWLALTTVLKGLKHTAKPQVTYSELSALFLQPDSSQPITGNLLSPIQYCHMDGRQQRSLGRTCTWGVHGTPHVTHHYLVTLIGMGSKKDKLFHDARRLSLVDGNTAQVVTEPRCEWRKGHKETVVTWCGCVRSILLVSRSLYKHAPQVPQHA